DRRGRRVPQGHDRAGRRGRVHGARPRRRARDAHGAAGAVRGLPRPRQRVRAGRGGAAGDRRRRGGPDTTTVTGARPDAAGRDATGLSETSSTEGAFSTLKRGILLSPEFRAGLVGTLLLALLSTAGRVVVPIAVQQTIDKRLGGPGSPDIGYIRSAVLVCAVAVGVTAGCAYLMNVRPYTASEGGPAGRRFKARSEERRAGTEG